MHKILLYPHGGSGNHGCEAIVRSTMLLLRPEEGVLFSSACGEDRRYGLDRTVRVLPEQRPIRRCSAGYVAAWMRRHVMGVRDAFDRLAFRGIAQEGRDASLALCGGGDNYCYGEPVHIYLQNDLLRRAGAPAVLWGCSLEREDMKGAMLEDLKAFDLIVARESLTCDALRECGCPRTVLYPDPAFALPVGEAALPEGWREGSMVGVNVSPLVIGHEGRAGAVMENYARLMEYVLDDTDMNVALIPHVVWESNDDRKPIRQLYEAFASTGRVIELPDGSAPELKGYISRCEMFIGARTHATIAAYSSCVPTLVVGYSIKARGIAKDLFGTDEGYVLPVQALAQKEDLVNAFDWLYKNAQVQKAHLQQIMPDYCKKAKEAENLLREL